MEKETKLYPEHVNTGEGEDMISASQHGFVRN